MYVRIFPGREFVIDKNDVLTRLGGKIDRLSGELVKDILIPALPYMQHGIEVSDLATRLGCDYEKLVGFMSDLLDARYIEMAQTHENISDTSSLFSFSTGGYADVSKTVIHIVGSRELYEIFKERELEDQWEVTDDLPCEWTDFKQHIAVLVTSLGIDAKVLHMNKVLLDNNVPYIFVSVGKDGELLVGPAVLPRKTACLQCKETRRRSNLTFAHENFLFEDYANVFVREQKVYLNRFQTSFVAELIHQQLLILLSAYRISGLENTIITYSSDFLNVETETFLRVPQCKACGTGSSINKNYIKQWSVVPSLSTQEQ